MYDAEQEATGFVNELFYREGPEPKDITRADAVWMRDTVLEYLREAYAAGAREGVS
jgi:hypothetical protein